MTDLNATAIGSPPPSPFAESAEDNGDFRHFFTGPVIKTELLVDWLEKHGIMAKTHWTDPNLADDGDLGREACVLVPATDFERAQQLFFAERQDEL